MPVEPAAAEAEEAPGPRPNRCNARVEDVIQSLFADEEPLAKSRRALGAAWRCFRSEVGQEPSEPYQVLTDPEKYNAPMRRKRKPTFTLDAAADAHSKDG
jgi:hypothetical protein